MENENDVAKRAIISHPKNSQKVIPGKSMANYDESFLLQDAN